MKTHQQRMRAGLRWWTLRKLWLIGSRLSRWAGQQMIKLSRKADARDCGSESKREAAVIDQPDPSTLRMFHGEKLRKGDWAVECRNPGHFLKVHPDEFGKLANDPRYSFFRQRIAAGTADEKPDGQAENA